MGFVGYWYHINCTPKISYAIVTSANASVFFDQAIKLYLVKAWVTAVSSSVTVSLLSQGGSYVPVCLALTNATTLYAHDTTQFCISLPAGSTINIPNIGGGGVAMLVWDYQG